MRVNRDVIAIFVLLTVLIGAGLLLTGPAEHHTREVGKEMFPDPSIYNDRASGSKALYEWTRKLGYAPSAWRQPWNSLPKSRAVLFVIDPHLPQTTLTLTGVSQPPSASLLKASDASVLRQWVSAGHTVCLLCSRLPTGSTPGGQSSTTFGDALDVIVETASRGGKTEFPPLQPVPETAGILSVNSQADARIRRKTPDALALFGDAAGPSVLSIPMGQGRLIVIADSQFASNGQLLRSENAAFLANTLARNGRRGDPILFDEYHHGDLEATTESVWTVLGRPLQLTLLQFLLGALALIGVVAFRFGPPVPLQRRIQRTSGEYVTSVASLYQRAQAAPAALDALYRQFLRDLTGRLGLAPDVSLEHLATVAARRSQTDKEELRRLLAACENALDVGKVTDAELIELTRRMERIRKDMGIA